MLASFARSAASSGPSPTIAIRVSGTAARISGAASISTSRRFWRRRTETAATSGRPSSENGDSAKLSHGEEPL